jgi:F-type H+-transporting ATPase subunit b
MEALIASILMQAEEHAEETSQAEHLYPEPGELIVGLIAFLILFFFTWKWVLPRFRQVLDERGQKIQGEMEQAEATRSEAQQLLEQYRSQLAGAREESNRIIEEARATAEQLRRDLQAKAEEEAQATVARAQDEIRAERARTFQELRSQVGSIAVELAERVVGQSLDDRAHQRLIDEYIDQVAAGNGSADGDGRARDGG